MHSEPVIKLITLNHNNKYQLLGLFHEFATLYRALGIACLTFDLSPLCEFQIFQKMLPQEIFWSIFSIIYHVLKSEPFGSNFISNLYMMEPVKVVHTSSSIKALELGVFEDPNQLILTWHRGICDQSGRSPKKRPYHCTSVWLTLAIAPNVGNSGA